jgi:hypothetical protein
MARAATAIRQDELDIGERNQLILATQAYFEALPPMHKTLIVELSEHCEDGPLGVLGKAIADGLERRIFEVMPGP